MRTWTVMLLILGAAAFGLQTTAAAQGVRVATEEDLQTLPKVNNTICPVSGEAIDAAHMDKAKHVVYNGKVYTLCCAMCLKDFKKDPAAFSQKAEASAAQE